jgi:methylmalonyl-CoA mutase cobalamin-binding domain/chain
MRIVGIDFRDGILFVPEVLLAANSMKGGMEILRPLLAETGVPPIGKVVIGTVKGDIHDIGKNLVAMMLEGAGFKVHNLGRDVAPEKFVQAVQEHRCNIVGISALMTTTMPGMKRTIDALVKAGVREQVKVMVGGAPVSQAFADEIGDDIVGEQIEPLLELALVEEPGLELILVGDTAMTVTNADGPAVDTANPRFQVGNLIRFGSLETGEYAVVTAADNARLRLRLDGFFICSTSSRKLIGS